MSALTLEQLEAVKEYRARTGCSLKEAVWAVRDGRPMPPATPDPRDAALRGLVERWKAQLERMDPGSREAAMLNICIWDLERAAESAMGGR